MRFSKPQNKRHLEILMPWESHNGNNYLKCLFKATVDEIVFEGLKSIDCIESHNNITMKKKVLKATKLKLIAIRSHI